MNISDKDWIDKLKALICLGENSAFLVPLSSRVSISFDDSVDKVRLEGLSIVLNRDYMSSLSLRQQSLVLIHELWHIVRLHEFRSGTRDLKTWNTACDIRINNDMIKDGLKIDDINGFISHRSMDRGGSRTEEDLYESLLIYQGDPQPIDLLDLDVEDLTDCTDADALDEVKEIVGISLSEARAFSSTTQNMLSALEVLDRFSTKIIPIRYMLQDWLERQASVDWSWKRPNRRYEDYRPSITCEEASESINVWLDTSGSMSKEQISVVLDLIRSIVTDSVSLEIVLWQFDTTIHKRDVFSLEKDPSVVLSGRGGTDIVEVVEKMATLPDEIHILISDLFFEHVDLPTQCQKVLIMTPSDHNREHRYTHRTFVYTS